MVVSAGGRWSWLSNARLLAGLLFVPHVDLAGRIVAHQHGGQAGRYAGFRDKLGHFRGDFARGLFRRQRFAIKEWQQSQMSLPLSRSCSRESSDSI